MSVISAQPFSDAPVKLAWKGKLLTGEGAFGTITNGVQGRVCCVIGL